MHDALGNRRQPSVKGRGQLAGEAFFGGGAQEVDVGNQVVRVLASCYDITLDASPARSGVYPEAVPGASGVACEPCRLAAISQKDRRE